MAMIDTLSRKRRRRANRFSSSGRAAGAAASPKANPAWRWWVLAVLGLGQLMVVLDGTIVNIALPSAQKALGFSNANRTFVITAYTLAFGGLLLLGGRCRTTSAANGPFSSA